MTQTLLFATASPLHLTRTTTRTICKPRRRFIASARSNDTPNATSRVREFALASAMVTSAVANRVVHRMQLTGVMQNYTFFIAQGATLCYALVYGTILATRMRLGIVPKRQFKLALHPANLRLFGIIGALEATTFVLQLQAAAYLPGTVIAVLTQSLLPFTMILSFLFLNRRYTLRQLLGAALVISGVLVCTLPGARGGAIIPWAAAQYGLSFTLLATSIALKERQLQRMRFDVFIVNTFGSSFQCLSTFLLLPLSIALATSLPALQYISSGLNAFFTAPYMPWLTLLYIGCNIVFNVFALNMVKMTSASTGILVNLFSVPILSLVFCLKLPLLEPSPFSWNIVAGLAVITFGVLLYSLRQASQAKTAATS